MGIYKKIGVRKNSRQYPGVSRQCIQSLTECQRVSLSTWQRYQQMQLNVLYNTGTIKLSKTLAFAQTKPETERVISVALWRTNGWSHPGEKRKNSRRFEQISGSADGDSNNY